MAIAEPFSLMDALMARGVGDRIDEWMVGIDWT